MPISWGPVDSKDEMLGRALTYLVLFSTLGIIVRWSFGVKLLTSAENDHDADRPDEEEEDSEDSLDEREGTLYANGENGEASPLIAEGGPGGRPQRKQSLHRKSSTISFSNPPSTLGYTNRPARSYDNDTALSSPNNKNLSLNKKTHASRKRPQSIFQSFPNTANPSEVGSDDEEDRRRAENEDEWGAERGAGRPEEDGPESAMGERWRSIKRKCGKGAMRIGRIAHRIGDFVSRFDFSSRAESDRDYAPDDGTAVGCASLTLCRLYSSATGCAARGRTSQSVSLTLFALRIIS